jgi:hypothetical protein
MKMLLAIFSLVLAMTVSASSETRTFFYDGSQDSVQLALRAEQTHTEYRYEQRSSICYRQEIFYRTVCQHRPQGGRVCRSVPHYRTIAYPCMQTIRIPYEVKDYDVEAYVNLSIGKFSETILGETFRVTLDGDHLSLAASSGSKKFFILLKKSEVKVSVHGQLKMIDASYEAELIEAAPVLKALAMTNISLRDSVLNFQLGSVDEQNVIGYSLNVSRAPLIGSNTTLFNRELATNEIHLTAEGKGSRAEVNLERLGVELTSGRYSLTAKTFFKYQEGLLNSAQFEQTESSRTLIYKIR